MHSTVQHPPQLTFVPILLIHPVCAAAHNIWHSGSAAIWQVSQVFKHNLCSGTYIFKHTTWQAEHCSKDSEHLKTVVFYPANQLSLKLISKLLAHVSHKGRMLFCSNRQEDSILLPIKGVAVCCSSLQCH